MQRRLEVGVIGKMIENENAKIYCHYYNNEKTCHYDAECIFLHEDYKFCRYDLLCEQNFRMVKHKKHVEPEDDNVNEEIETARNAHDYDSVEDAENDIKKLIYTNQLGFTFLEYLSDFYQISLKLFVIRSFHLLFFLTFKIKRPRKCVVLIQ